MWTILDKFKLFVIQVFNAIKFTIFDYDSKLQRTKSLHQRIVIWFSIFSISVVLFVVMIFIFIFFVKKYVFFFKM